MPVDFSIGWKSLSLGRVANPVIPLLVRTRRGYVPFDFLIDTDADCSMIPASIAQAELGVALARCPQETFFGIEGHGIRVFRGSLALKIGPHPVRVRCVFSSREHTPLILGRDHAEDFLRIFGPKLWGSPFAPERAVAAFRRALAA